MKNKKILIATGIYPPDIGGPATLLAALPQALRERNFEVKILTYSDLASTAAEKKDGLFRVKRSGNKIWQHLKYFVHLAILAEWAEIIYATDLYSVGRGAWFLKKVFGKKYLIRFAGDSAWEKAAAAGKTDDFIVDFEAKRQPPELEKLKARRRLILQRADAVIVVSHFMADLAKKIGVNPLKIKTIYNAVNFFDNLPPRQESEDPVLVFSGRLVPWKDQRVILNILTKLKQKYSRIIFEILGDGPELENLKKLAQEKNLDNSVKFHGRVSEAKTHKIFAYATIFVLNTNYEGLPHAVLNAMQVGVPVVTTALGGNLEVVADGENGLLVPYNDEIAWQAAIEKLLADANLREKLVQSAKKTLEKFSFEEMVEKTAMVINSL